MEKDKRNYEPVLVKENVMIKVPNASHVMTRVDAHTFELHNKIVQIDSHWKNGLLIAGTGVILNRLFYGIIEEDLGKKIVATVRVVQKTTKDGRKYLMLDIVKAPNGTKATLALKFSDQDGVLIPGTNIYILFKQR